MDRHEVQIADITIPENRQRKDLGDLTGLAASIKEYGLINAVVITRDNILIAGERRLTACRDILKLDTIPVHYRDELSEEDRHAIELEENVRRLDLKWQERVIAIKDYHELCLRKNPNWTQEKTSKALHIDGATLSRSLWVASEIDDPQIATCDGVGPAYRILQRRTERATAAGLEAIAAVVAPTSIPETLDISSDPVDVAKRAATATWHIENQNCMDYIPDSPLFNFIHCDFPYGVNIDRSDQMGTKSGQVESYKDSDEVYWALCDWLVDNLDNLLLPEAHCMFWFPMAKYTETVALFRRRTDFVVNPYPLFWHKTDDRGVLPDPARGPRRVYETALLMSRGDRKIVRAVSNSYGCPTQRASSIHVSQKAEPMLRHYFSMLVDEYSSVLDPTCGSGSAIRAAISHNARYCVGLEQNPEYAEEAEAETTRHWKLKHMTEAV